MPGHVGRSHLATFQEAHRAAIVSNASLLHSEHRVKQISTDTDLYTAAMMTSAIAEIHAGDLAQLDTELQCQDEAISAARNPVGFARITKEANRLTPV